jgi:hypothetical protein
LSGTKANYFSRTDLSSKKYQIKIIQSECDVFLDNGMAWSLYRKGTGEQEVEGSGFLDVLFAMYPKKAQCEMQIATVRGEG